MTSTEPTQPLTDAELAAIEQRHDNAHEDMRSYSAETLRLQNTARDVPRLLAEVDRLRAENDGYRAAICFETTCTGCAGLLDQMVRLEAENAAARAIHQPVTVDWSASPKCKSAHGPSWVNWPCPDAFALGITKGDNDE